MHNELPNNNHKIECEVDVIFAFIEETSQQIEKLNQKILDFRQKIYSLYNSQVLKFKNLDELHRINRNWSKQDLLDNTDIKCFFPNITDDEIQTWLNQADEK